MSWIATESATAPDHIGKPVENATETKSPHETRDRSKPYGKAGYVFALMRAPMQIIRAKWSKNPDAPKLTDRHIRFLEYLWSAGGQMQNVDEYTVQVEVDPRWGVGRDEYAADISVAKSTVARWAADLKAHGLLATRKTRLREKNPMGQGRTVWIVRLPVNAISDVRDVRSARATDERERRDQFTDWRDGSAPKPASRTPKHRAECAAQAVFNGRVDGHTVQEPTAPQVSPVGRGEVSPVGRGEVSPVGRGQVSPVGRAETVQQLRQEQQTTTPPPRTAHERERDAGAQAAHGGGGCDVINAEQEQPHSPTADQRVRGKQRGQRASEHRHPRTREMLAHLGILASTHDALLAPYRSLPDDLALRRSMWLIVGHRNGLEIETDDPRDLGIEMSSVILKVDLHKARNPPGAAHHRLRGATDQITTVYNDIVRLHEAWVREGSPSAEQRRTRETEHKQREWQRQLDAEKARDAEREAQRVADEASRREQAEIEHRRAVERQEQERRQAEREAQLVAVLDALDVQQRGDLEQQRRDIIESKYPREMHDDPNAQRLIDNARKHQVAKALAVSGLTCPHRRALVIERG